MNSRILQLSLVAVVLLGWLFPADASAVRIKDIAYVQGVRENQLLGYGLVVGLDGTGDYGSSEFTVQSTASMLSRMGIKVDKKTIRTRNAAAVMVTAELPPFAQSGQRLDVTVSSLGNAKSLQGGTLLMTPLMGPDGDVYAMAQGAMSIGGFGAAGPTGRNRVQKNHLTAGRVPNGALVEQDVAVDLSKKTEIRLVLQQPDFATAVEVAKAVSNFYGQNGNNNPKKPMAGIAKAVDASTVRVEVPDAFTEAVPQFISTLELLDVTPSRKARVVVNERTGTVVLGGDVRISEVAVAHGALSVTVSTDFQTTPASPLTGGENTTTPDEEVDVVEENPALKVVSQGASIADVVAGLNALGASPRDLIAILQAIDGAGALHAELVIQ